MLPVLVSVSTQTCGGVDSSYFTLSVLSESSVSLSMSALDLSSDESSDFLASRKVMSSQTDLTLSDFDFGVCRESDDFDDESDEGLDNSFNPYELLTDHPTQESWYSNIGIPSNPSSPAINTESGSLPGKRPTEEPDAENQCQQFFDLLRNQCNAQSGQKRGDDWSCRREQPDTYVEERIDTICRSAWNENGGRIVARKVPKMGTKVEFNRPVNSPSSGRAPSHPPWQLPLHLDTRFAPPIITLKSNGDFRGRNPDHNSNPLDVRADRIPDHNFNPLVPRPMRIPDLDSIPFEPRPIRNPDHNSNPIDLKSTRNPDPNSNAPDPRLAKSNSGSGSAVHAVGFYHSDSERWNPASKFPRNLREWNSDGDSKNLSFPSSDDSADQSPEPHDTQRDDPEKTDSLRRLYEQYADVMYTNEANLQHTIMVQQRLFEQQIANRIRPDELKLHAKSKQPTRSIPLQKWAPHESEQIVPLEWVIKRRADGTRYITRRPLAAKGRERVKQASPVDEKTTDNDAGGEPKPGRYWTKEEGRKHNQRDWDQKRDGVVKLGVAQETAQGLVPPGDTRKTKVKKEHIRVRSKDHAVTFQELLTHGRLEAQGKPSENPLLSVITI